MVPILSATTIQQLNLWINPDIDLSIIDQATVNVQRSTIRTTLGYQYWDSIYNQFLSGSGYTTEDAYILDNYIYDVIAFGVALELIPTLYAELNQDGLRIVTSSQSTFAPDKLISMYLQSYQNKIDERRTEMVKYMNDNRLKYPIYFRYNGRTERNVTFFNIHRIGRGGKRWM